MQEAGWETESLLFNNRKHAALKFLLFFFNPVSFWKTCRAIRRFKPDIVHVHNWFFAASPAVFIAARWMRVPVVHTIHNFRILCPSSFLFVKNELFLDCMSRVFPLEAIRRRIYRDSAFNTGWLLTGTRLHYFLGTWQRIDRLICLTSPARQMLVDSLLRIEPERIGTAVHLDFGRRQAVERAHPPPPCLEAVGRPPAGRREVEFDIRAAADRLEEGFEAGVPPQLVGAFDRCGRRRRKVADGPGGDVVQGNHPGEGARYPDLDRAHGGSA